MVAATSIKVSTFFCIASNQGAPRTRSLAFHAVSGEAFPVDDEVIGVLARLRRLGHANTAALFRQLGASARQTFAILYHANLIVNADVTDELELLLDYFLYSRRGVLALPSALDQDVVVTRDFESRDPEAIAQLSLDPFETRLLRLADGSRRLGDALEEVRRELNLEHNYRRRRLLGRLAHPRFQLVKLCRCSGAELRRLRHWPAYLGVGIPLRKGHKTDGHTTEATSKAFHRRRLSDASSDFDVFEKTVSHAFRHRTRALRGRTYGEAFVDQLQREATLDGARVIVEVGGGLGLFAQSFLTRLQGIKPHLMADLRYVIIDLSPALLAAQVKNCAGARDHVRFIHADAEMLPLCRESVDVLVANEVLADLTNESVSRTHLKRSGIAEQGSAATFMRRFGIRAGHATAKMYINIGAFKFLDGIWNSLKPGGTAICVEYGSEHTVPVRAAHLNHPEFSIFWPHIIQAARVLGFRVALRNLTRFLHFNIDEELFAGSTNALQRLLSLVDVTIDRAAYGPHELASVVPEGVLCAIRGLEFAPARAERHFGPGLSEFQVLVLRKPARAKRRSRGRLTTGVRCPEGPERDVTSRQSKFG